MAVTAAVVVAAVLDGALGSGALVDSPFALLVGAGVGLLLGAWAPAPSAVCGVLVTAAALTFANQRHFPDAYPVADDAAFFLLVLGAPAVVGASLVARTRQVRHLAMLSDQLASLRTVELEAARLEEQHRIELAVHNRLVEQLGAIALRADGAGRATERAARDLALAEVEAMARHGLDDLRRALGLLREDVEPAPAAGPVHRGRLPAEPLVGRGDIALATGLAVAMAIESVVSDASRGPVLTNVIASAVVAAPVVVRRRRPLVAAAATLILAAATSAWLTPSPELVSTIAVLLVISYAVGAHARGWSRLVGAGIVGAGCLCVALASPVRARDPDGLLPTLVWCGLAVAAGVLGAGWGERAARLGQVVEDLQRGRDAATRAATARQRQVMARDLHDSVAHTLTVVCLSAGAARRVGEEAAAEAFATIVLASRAGIAELRTGLDALVPLDGLLRPQTIRATAGALGVHLDVDVPEDLSLDAASTCLVHRLLREAVVNAARHAPGAALVVRLEQQEDRIVVKVTDDGSGVSIVDVGTGTGLLGLAAQLEEHGGHLDHGPRPQGGWAVTATLPSGAAVRGRPTAGAGAGR